MFWKLVKGWLGSIGKVINKRIEFLEYGFCYFLFLGGFFGFGFLKVLVGFNWDGGMNIIYFLRKVFDSIFFFIKLIYKY